MGCGWRNWEGEGGVNRRNSVNKSFQNELIERLNEFSEGADVIELGSLFQTAK